MPNIYKTLVICLWLANQVRLSQVSALLHLPPVSLSLSSYAHFSTIDNKVGLHFTHIYSLFTTTHTCFVFLQNSIFSSELNPLLQLVVTVYAHYLIDYYSALLLHGLYHRSMSNRHTYNYLILCHGLKVHFSRFKQAYKLIIQQKLVTQLRLTDGEGQSHYNETPDDTV